MSRTDFIELFPSYIWIDIEASSLSVESWPCEFGWTAANLKASSFLIRPLPDWRDWSTASEVIHGISLNDLSTNGIDAADAAKCMNQVCRGKQVLSDNPESDSDWIGQLFHDVGVRQEFTLQDARQLEAMAAALSNISPGEAQSYIERVNRTFPHPHRAAPDCRREAARFLTLALPHEWEAILAMA